MSVNDTEQELAELLAGASEALARGAWEAARSSFAAACARHETPDALEGLALAAWWLDDGAVTLRARERAYRLYRQQGDRRGAARMAVALAYDRYSFHGEHAVANGWLQRAQRLLHGLDRVPERGLLAVISGHFALLVYNDTATAAQLAAQAAALAHSLDVPDLEMMALALEGLVMVSGGQVAEGMRRLDECAAAAVAGEISDPETTVNVCCYLIFACERVRDYDRAAQWCRQVTALSERWAYRSMFSYCRIHYAGVLMWRGDWSAAEAELLAAKRELAASRPVDAAESVVHLAELRRRQGRLSEAAALLHQVHAHPSHVPPNWLVLPVEAALALDRGDAASAADVVEHLLRGTPAETLTERAAGLELLVRSRLALGDRRQAEIALAELQAIAAGVAIEPLHASVHLATGLVNAAAGEHAVALQRFEDAADLFARNGTPFETAHARLELARCLAALGRAEAAAEQARSAHEVLCALGAAHEAERAAALLRELAGEPPVPTDPTGDPAGLTRREVEVLRLIAAGLSNAEIAADLVMSVRTVERHIANIYGKLGVGGKVGRASATAYALRHSLTS